MDTKDYNIFDDVIDNDDYYGLNQNFFIEESFDTKPKFISSTINSKIRTLSEVFLEWFLFDSSEEKTLESFIKSENIDAFITPEQFMDIMSNNAHLDEPLILLVQQKLPFQVPLKKMYYLNSQARKNYTYCIKVPPEIIHDLIKKELDLKKEKIKQHQKQYYEQNRDKIAKHQKQYYEENRDKIAEYQKQYYEENRDKILEYTKQYYEENRDKIAKHQKQYYEENRDKIAKYQKQYQEKNRDKIAKQKKQYCEINRDKIAKYQKQYREQNRDKIAEYQKQYYEENRDKIAEYKKQYYKENYKKVSEQQKQYREVNHDKIVEREKQYREQNHDKIVNWRKQYQEKNRDKIAEQRKKNRDKKLLERQKKHDEKLHKKFLEFQKKNNDRPLKVAARQEKNRDKMLKRKERKEMAKSVCPAFLFLDSLKKENIVVYLTLHKKHSDIIGKAIKSCTALQNMDFTLCPLFKSVDSEQYMKESCPMPNAFVLPQSFDIIRNFVTVLKQR